MSHFRNRIARAALSVLAAGLLVPAIALTPAAAQDLGALKKLCVSAASAELQRQGQAEGKSVQPSDAQLGTICAKFLNTPVAGPEPTCPPELAAYVKQLGLKQQPATQATCLEMWYALTRGGL